jgi:hypothetical protein
MQITDSNLFETAAALYLPTNKAYSNSCHRIDLEASSAIRCYPVARLLKQTILCINMKPLQ